MNGNLFENAMNQIYEKAVEKTTAAQDDYIGEDGFLYCCKCNTPLQCKIKWIDGNDRVVPVMCECQSKQEEKRKQMIKRKEEIDRINELKKDSLIDSKFLDCTFESVIITAENKHQLEICKRYAQKFDDLYEKNQGLLLCGEVGTGKTHFACCIGNYLMERLNPVFATSFIKVLKAEKRFKTDEDEDRFFSRINEAKLLILDDLGAERSTDYALEIVYGTIDSRYRSGKPMIVTTNLTLKEMKEATDERYSRIYDRIFEVCYPVEFVGKSWRKRAAAARFNEMTKLLET